MQHPAIALAWHSWRLSRRWYLLILAVAVAVPLTLMSTVPQGQEQFLYGGIARVAARLNLFLALVTTLIAISLGGRTGFPLRFEFRLPVTPTLLASVPMLTLGLLCTSLYVVPALLCRFLLDVALPLLKPAALVGTTAVLFAAASWAMAGRTARSAAVFLAFGVGLLMVFWLQPFQFARPANASLSAALAVQLLLGVILLYAMTVRGVRLQRQGESWRLPAARQGAVSGKPRRFHGVAEFCMELFQVACPTGSASAAELWSEFKRYGMPVLMLGMVMALVMPWLPLAGALTGTGVIGLLATAMPFALLLSAIGIGVINRRAPSQGYMNAFEATRALGTARMAGIQMGSLGMATALGLGCIAIGQGLFVERYADPGPLWMCAARIVAGLRDATLIQQLGAAVLALTGLFAAIALFLCLHSCSLFWGRKVFYGTLVFFAYASWFAISMLTGDSARNVVVQNMWWIAGAVLALTTLLAVRAAALRLMARNLVVWLLLAWMVFIACALVTLERYGVHLLSQAPELQAFHAAWMTLPLTLWLGAVWCYDRLRHR